MSDAATNPELLRSLGRLVRGLSALFWGLPAALIVCVGTVVAGWFDGLGAFGVVPALATTVLLCYGLRQMGHFQKQERPWREALDRAGLLALVNAGLSPFLHWCHKIPGQPFFLTAVAVLALSGLLFLFNLNLVLARLGAMLPDETLRQETRHFTAINRGLLLALVLLVTGYVLLMQIPDLPERLVRGLEWVERARFLSLLMSLVVFLLLPLSLTMALIWKTKEVILESLFAPRL